jgi:hypothetical protein
MRRPGAGSLRYGQHCKQPHAAANETDRLILSRDAKEKAADNTPAHASDHLNCFHEKTPPRNDSTVPRI